jgi:hypothetical protein
MSLVSCKRATGERKQLNQGSFLVSKRALKLVVAEECKKFSVLVSLGVKAMAGENGGWI